MLLGATNAGSDEDQGKSPGKIFSRVGSWRSKTVWTPHLKSEDESLLTIPRRPVLLGLDVWAGGEESEVE